MKYGLTDYVRAIARDKRRERLQLNQGSIIPHLELVVERSGQGGQDCPYCAAVPGRYDCEPSAARSEWRHTEAGVDVVVSLLWREPTMDPRLRASLLVERNERVHAAAVYHSDPLTPSLLEGPWVLKLTLEDSDCNLPFPTQVEIVCRGKLFMQTERLPYGNGR